MNSSGDGELASPVTLSVYVTTRNRPVEFERALRSVLDQTFPPFEIVVVDDASTHPYAQQIVSELGASNTAVVRMEAPVGACRARNIAIQRASGEFITGLDDDDEMLPGRLAALAASFEPSVAFVCASDVLVDSRGERRRRVAPLRIGLQALLERNLVGNQVLTLRERVLAVGGFDEDLPAAQDYDLWIRLVQNFGEARGLPQVLQRVHEAAGARISASPRRRRGYWMVYRKHKNLMSEEARASHLLGLRLAAGRQLRLADLRVFGRSSALRQRMLARWLAQHFPSMQRVIARAAEWWLRSGKRG